jgi:hypothetical protein
MRLVKIVIATVAAAFWTTVGVASQHGQAHPTPAPTPHHGETAHRPETPHQADHHVEPAEHVEHAEHGIETPRHRGDHTTRTGTTPSTTTSSRVANRIQSHPQLASRVRALLPQGMTLQQAASGFRNQGQFIAALHVSRNLGIPFADLKREMVTNHLSLGQAIHKLRPNANATIEAEHGTHEAEHDVATTPSGTTTTGTTTTTTRSAKRRG